MPIAQLFENLNNHYHLPLDFSESIAQLESLSFSETGMKLKKILEESYTDGIDGFEGVENNGKEITGVFLDKVSPKVTKRYRFTISMDGISYQLENPNDVNFTELEFAAVKGKKSCPNSTPCGLGCISKSKKCRINPSPQAKEAIAQLLQPQKPDSISSTSPQDRSDYAKSLKSSKRGETLTRAKKNLKKIPDSPPPYAEELAAVEMYSSLFYGAMNSVLRGEDINLSPSQKKDVDNHIKMASAALGSMPKFDGNVYRGAVLPNEVLKQYREGQSIEEKAFTSTTTNKNVAEDFASADNAIDGYTPVLYQIKSKKGVAIKDFSIIPKEEEVLFAPSAKFKVSKIEKGNGRVTIYMEDE